MIKKGKIVFCVILSCALLSGCGSNSQNSDNIATTTSAATASESSVTASPDSSQSASVESDQKFGEITAIDGNSITIALANMPEGGSGTAPSDMPEGESGTAPSDMPEGGSGTAPSDMPEGGSGTAPSDMPEGENDGQNLDLTGESITITIDDQTEITVDGQTASVSDLQVDDVVSVTMSGNTVTSIQTGMNGGSGNSQE